MTTIIFCRIYLPLKPGASLHSWQVMISLTVNGGCIQKEKRLYDCVDPINKRLRRHLGYNWEGVY